MTYFILSVSFLAIRCFLVINFVLVIVGTTYFDYIKDQRKKLPIKNFIDVIGINNNAGDTVNNNNVINVEMMSAVDVDDKLKGHKTPRKRESFIDRFSACFSLSKNSEIITTTYLGTDSIEVIHGMRSADFSTLH